MKKAILVAFLMLSMAACVCGLEMPAPEVATATATETVVPTSTSTSTPDPTSTPVPTATHTLEPTVTPTRVLIDQRTLELEIAEEDKTALGIWMEEVVKYITDPDKAGMENSGYFSEGQITLFSASEVVGFVGSGKVRHDLETGRSFYLYAEVDGEEVWASPYFCDAATDGCAATIIVTDYEGHSESYEFAFGMSLEEFWARSTEVRPFIVFGEGPDYASIIYGRWVGNNSLDLELTYKCLWGLKYEEFYTFALAEEILDDTYFIRIVAFDRDFDSCIHTSE